MSDQKDSKVDWITTSSYLCSLEYFMILYCPVRFLECEKYRYLTSLSQLFHSTNFGEKGFTTELSVLKLLLAVCNTSV